MAAVVAVAEQSGCLIISGMPGAGKSTVAPLVAAAYPRAAHISGDVLSYMVVKGRVGFNGRPAEESDRQLRLCARNMAALADNFADAGIVPVVEYAITAPRTLEAVVSALRTRPVMFVVLAPPPRVCRERNAARAAIERVDFDVAPYDRLMRERLGGIGWWLDSASQTPEETAALITAHAAERAVLGAGDPGISPVDPGIDPGASSISAGPGRDR